MLPVVNEIQFSVEIPSTKERIHFSPFTVRQQKGLLVARESNDPLEIANSIINIIQECVIEDIDVKQLASFDIEYLFLQIRAKSIGEVIDFKLPHYRNEECNHVNELQLVVDDVRITWPENHTNKIQINDQYGVVLKYPTLDTFKFAEDMNSVESNLKFLAAGIGMVYDNEQVYDQFNAEDAYNFVLTLTPPQAEKLFNFYRDLPHIDYRINYKCQKCGQDDELVFRSLTDFFMLG